MTVKDILKKCSFFPPLFVVATNLISSFITRLFTSGGTVYDIATDLDKAIPFLPGFIHIYFLAFVQWAICLVAVMILDDEKSWYYCMGISVANLLSGVVFLIYPTVMGIRPPCEGGDAFTQLVGNFLFSADDPPMNILPSLHCLHSWACMRMVFAVKRVPGYLKWINAIFTMLVILSVLLVKQHLLIDIPTGILIFEAGLLITRFTGIDKKLSALRRRILF